MNAMLALILTAAVALLLGGLVVRLHRRRVQRKMASGKERLATVLQTTKARVWLYDVQSRRVSWMTADGEVEPEEHTFDEYANWYRPETFSQLTAALDGIVAGRQECCQVELVTDSDSSQRDVVITAMVLRRSDDGRPSMLAGVVDDQTEQLIQRRKAKDNLLRYQTIFNTSMVDMTYYNTDGILTNINQKACRTMHCDREELLKERVPFTYALEDNTITVDQFEGSYSTHLLKAGNNSNVADSIRLPQDMYYEQQLIPIYDSDRQFLGIFGSGRDVTEFVNSYHQLKLSIRQMAVAAEQVTDYINNINYALHVGGVRLVKYSPDTHIMTIYKEMNVVQLTLTQSRCLSLLTDASRRVVMRLMDNMDQRSADAVDVDIDTTVRAAQNRRLSLQFHMVPIKNDSGVVDGYFGMCRDVSQERATAEELEREKAKAQEVESVKNAFLHNMSYEIRTPIATVVGFAQLFAEEHAPEDEDSFIAEIKQNATYLLKLVNDILFLSRLDAHMIEFKRQPTDLAKTFEGHCHMGWGKEQKSTVSYEVVNPYEQLVVELDETNVGYIVEQLADNAAHYTGSGYVRTRFDYIGDRLLITVDDTGCGIPMEKQQTMFERFSTPSDGRRTGLGLPICKELAQQMGGDIQVNSAPGRGTTVWVTIPCRATVIVKRLCK